MKPSTEASTYKPVISVPFAPPLARRGRPVGGPPSELEQLERQVRSATALLPLARQVAALEPFHLGDVKYERPDQEIKRALSATIIRAATLLREGKLDQDVVLEIQGGALALLASDLLADVTRELSPLAEKHQLAAYDYSQIQLAHARLDPIRQALGQIAGDSQPISKVRDALGALDADIHQLAMRPLAPAATSEAETLESIERVRARIKRRQPSIAPSSWRQRAERDSTTIQIWRGLLEDGLALLENGGERHELHMEIGHGLLNRGTKLLEGLFDTLIQRALDADEASAIQKSLAAEAAEVWLSAVAKRAEAQLGAGDAVGALYVLAEPLKKIAAQALTGAPALDRTLAMARALYDGALPAVFVDVRAFLAQADHDLAEGKPASSHQASAEMWLIQLRRVPEGTEGLEEVKASVRNVYKLARETAG